MTGYAGAAATAEKGGATVWAGDAAGTLAVAVNQSRLRVVQMTDYRYLAPATRVRTELRLAPPPVHGGQRLLEHQLRVAPLPHAQPRRRDAWGNEVVEIHHEKVTRHLTFAVEMVVETRGAFNEAGLPLPLPIPPDPDVPSAVFRTATARTLPDDSLKELARELRRGAAGAGDATGADGRDGHPHPMVLYRSVCERVHREMTFASGATGVETPASEAWSNRRGVCQDYAHITLALCRLCGLPARYVSGFVPGEGVMHAWVEALLPAPPDAPEDAAPCWFAYDPTYNKWVDDGYVMVAVGRDYGDITPTSGTYYGGGGPNEIRYRNRVTRIEREVILL